MFDMRARFVAVSMTRIVRMTLSCVLLLGGSALHAAMQLDRTRLVIHEAEGSAVLQVRSKDAHPLLLQIWIDQDAHDGREDSAALLAASDVPFITDPPVMRLEPGRSRAVQVLMTRVPAALPMDRESLYWLNVLEVPATVDANSSGAAANRLHMGLQSQLKLFYRPKALARYAEASALDPADRLRFTLARDADNRAWLSIHNPAPIYQSLATLVVHPSAAGAAPLELDAPALAPFEEVRLPLPSAVGRRVNTVVSLRLTFATINDDGNLIEDEQTL